MSAYGEGSGFHFSAKNTTENKLAEFKIQDMAEKMQGIAPVLWETLNVLLEANPKLTNKRNWARRKAQSLGKARRSAQVNPVADGDIDLADLQNTSMDISNEEDEEYWAAFEEEEAALLTDYGTDEPIEVIVNDIEEQFSRLKKIVRKYSHKSFQYTVYSSLISIKIGTRNKLFV